eukprot:COSAG06_NODE_19241_length_847_cov_1.239305_1_plen_229_part_10
MLIRKKLWPQRQLGKPTPRAARAGWRGHEARSAAAAAAAAAAAGRWALGAAAGRGALWRCSAAPRMVWARLRMPVKTGYVRARGRDHTPACRVRSALALVALASLWTAGLGHPRDSGCPSTIEVDRRGLERSVAVDSGHRTVIVAAPEVPADGTEAALIYQAADSDSGGITLGPGRVVGGVGASFISSVPGTFRPEPGSTYGIVTSQPTHASLLCLYEVENGHDGILRG